ncbi:MAG: M35 family metallo-endopeptidase [Pseudomonadota bacterium]
MGLVVTDPALKEKLKPFEKPLDYVFRMAANRINTIEGQKAAKRWFGIQHTDNMGRQGIARTLEQMHVTYRRKDISVGVPYSGTAFVPNILRQDDEVNGQSIKANAPKAFTDNLETFGQNSTQNLPDEVADLHIIIFGGFDRHRNYLALNPPPPPGLALPFGMRPQTGVRRTIPSQAHMHQSRFGVLIHELSHVLLGVEDRLDGNNIPYYGTERAEPLAVNQPAAAQDNAENWAIFVEALGYHNSH